MHEIWGIENYIMFFFTLNIIKTYDKVVCRQLIHVLKIKRILKNMANWMHSFIINKIITLIIKNYKIKKILISIKISQKLLLSLIFYLFYIIELLEACNNISKKLNTNKFINNTNLLIYKSFMKYNYNILIKAHDKYLNWIKYYKIFFNLKKYELIHLSHILYKFNIEVML